jgi:hypothetical protein
VLVLALEDGQPCCCITSRHPAAQLLLLLLLLLQGYCRQHTPASTGSS